MIKNYSYTSRHNKENDVINLSKTIRKKWLLSRKDEKGTQKSKAITALFIYFFLNLKLKNECKIPMQLRVK